MIDGFIAGILGVDSSSVVVTSLSFFVRSSVKIALLLFLMMSFVSFLRSFIPPQKVRSWISKRHPIVAYFAASLFGAITPFCSCSSIPVFIGLVGAGVPFGPTIAFLITSPLINTYLVAIMLGFFGLKITLLYILAGVVIGVISGFVLDKIGFGKHVREDIVGGTSHHHCKDKTGSRFLSAVKESAVTLRKLMIWIMGGVALGVVIDIFVPSEIIQSLISGGGPFVVPLAVVLGVPVYASCAAIVPVAFVLFGKGLPLGTALAFMMATASLSLPEAVLLKRVMRARLVAVFFFVVAVGIILIGYLFNAFM